MESEITIKLVHGGFVLTTAESVTKTEVFTSQGKLMKALRAAIEAQSLVKKDKAEGSDTE